VNQKHLKKVNKIKSYRESEIKRTGVSQMWVKYVTPDPIHAGPFPLQHRLFDKSGEIDSEIVKPSWAWALCDIFADRRDSGKVQILLIFKELFFLVAFFVAVVSKKRWAAYKTYKLELDRKSKIVPKIFFFRATERVRSPSRFQAH